MVKTPLIFDKKLWETSGHWEHYSENMFSFEEDAEKGVESHEDYQFWFETDELSCAYVDFRCSKSSTYKRVASAYTRSRGTIETSCPVL